MVATWVYLYANIRSSYENAFAASFGTCEIKLRLPISNDCTTSIVFNDSARSPSGAAESDVGCSSLTEHSTRELFSKVFAQPRGERNDGERRIGMPSRWKNRTSRDV